MTAGPSSSPVRRSRRPLVLAVAAVVLVVVVIIGLIIVNVLNGSSAKVPGLVRVVDAAPVPTGSTTVHETDVEAHGDVTATVERQYRLPGALPTAAIQKLLVAARYRVIDPQTGDAADIPGGSWSAEVGTTSGDVYVLPPDRTGGGIEYLWKENRLWVTAQDGALDGS